MRNDSWPQGWKMKMFNVRICLLNCEIEPSREDQRCFCCCRCKKCAKSASVRDARAVLLIQFWMIILMADPWLLINDVGN